MNKKYTNQYTLKQNIIQHFQVISSFIPEGLTIEFNNTKHTFPPFPSFRISPSFFYSYPCQHCGGCCRRYNLIWDKFTAEDLGWTNEKQLPIKVNEKETIIYYKQPNLSQKYCVLAEKKLLSVWCTKYMRRPLLSRLPHIFLGEFEGKILLMKRPFGRNYSIKCKAKKHPFSWDEFNDSDIPTLFFIQNILKEYKLDTHIIDKTIKFLKSLDDDKIKEILKRGNNTTDPLVVWGTVNHWELTIEQWLNDYNKKHVSLDKYLSKGELKCPA